MSLPSANYLSENFTMSAWVKRTSTVAGGAAIADFGNGMGVDNVNFFFAPESGTNRYFNNLGAGFVTIGDYLGDSNVGYGIWDTKSLVVNQWTHITVTLEGGLGILYVNGAVAARALMPTIKVTTRSSNYIGATNWRSFSNSMAMFDDLKIFNRALTPSEVTGNMYL